MANHASALKRHRQSLKRYKRNHETKSKLRTLIKKVFAASDKKSANSILKDAVSELSKAGRRGVFHKKNTSRKISRLQKHVNNLS